jgi:hypothetical protein
LKNFIHYTYTKGKKMNRNKYDVIMKALCGDYLRIKLTAREVAEGIRAGVKFVTFEQCAEAGYLDIPMGHFISTPEGFKPCVCKGKGRSRNGKGGTRVCKCKSKS